MILSHFILNILHISESVYALNFKANPKSKKIYKAKQK